MTVRHLTAAKYQRAQVCAEVQSGTKAGLVYDLCTALELQSVELPMEHVLDKRRLHVAVRGGGGKRNLRGVAFHRYSRPFDEVLVDRRFRCVALPDVWMHYAAVLSLEELVVLTDCLMRRDGRLHRVGLETLIAEFESVEGRFDGKRKCRQALRLAREGTDSSYETRLRLVLMMYGLPCPEVNYPVSCGGAGKRGYFLDMAYPEWMIAIEYDGEHHGRQWKQDNGRREALENMGWSVIKVFYEDLRDEAARVALVERVALRIRQKTGIALPLVRRSVERLADGRSWRYGTLQCR
ncbi:endonuclease domain-containing protein [Bifidobacterium simiarum]|uniref:endonuclease domain-containing protein n=1 Tax=Bifidobacterium simiarum TaxID=2045441 RepID=UPI001BDCE01B|nr:DUF559 domain-containing protein [Bifidobacterium simiarum]MBT1165935.1 DUF559 domain-containing protein [Bifidobacterium simiarum]